MAEETGQMKVRDIAQGIWIIERFSFLSSQVGKYYSSETFQLEKSGIRWLLKLYPGGRCECDKGYVSCFVRKLHEKQKNYMKFKFVISLRNTKGRILRATMCDDLPYYLTDYGHKLESRKYLIAQLVNDTLLVTVEVIHGMDYGEITQVLKLTDDLRNLWTTKQNADCVISVEGKDIPVHSIILGARSKVFAAMFKYDTKEKNTRRVEVIDFKEDAINSMMEFLYSGRVKNLDFDQSLELLRAGDKYQVSDLKLYCSNYLMSHLDNDNVCQILFDADIYNADELRIKAMKYFCKSVFETDFSEKLSIFLTRPELLCRIIQQMAQSKKTEQPKPT